MFPWPVAKRGIESILPRRIPPVPPAPASLPRHQESAVSPPPGPRSPVAFFLILSAVAATFVAGLAGLFGRGSDAVLWVSAAYFIYELGIALVFAFATSRALRARSRRGGVVPRVEGTVAPMSVLIAAHNERACIASTIESVRRQGGVEWEIVVASDGSDDGMNDFLIGTYQMTPVGAGDEGVLWRSVVEPRLALLALPKIGKGRALNAALAEARYEIACTLDADTALESDALRALSAVFRDAGVASAGGFLYVRNTRPGGPLLARYQYWEYLKNFLWRLGLVHMDVCLQVSGAFGAFRRSTLMELGGFSTTSAVEDYEIIFRLHERLRLAQRPDRRVEVAPGAVALTDGPETAGAFIAQRTRWFAGFLETLWRYRRMVGDPRHRALGLVLLPLKCVDAVLPLWGFFSLLVLLGALASQQAHIQLAAGAIFVGKITLESATAALLWRWHRAHFPTRTGVGRLWPFILTEGLVFHWFRQIAVLRSYGRFARGERAWTPIRAAGRDPFPLRQPLDASEQ